MLPSKANPPSKRIALTRTRGEWDKLDKIFKEKGFHTYIRQESSRIANMAKKCLECVTPAAGEKIQRRHQIPTPIYEDLLAIANLRGIPVGQFLDDLLLTPLLLPDKDAAL